MPLENIFLVGQDKSPLALMHRLLQTGIGFLCGRATFCGDAVPDAGLRRPWGFLWSVHKSIFGGSQARKYTFLRVGVQ